MNSQARLAAVMAAVVLVTVGCSGPREDLSVGVSEVASDIVLGSPPKLPSPSAPPVPIPPNGIPLPRPASPVGALPEAPELPERPSVVAPVRCPAASPLDAPKLVAPNDVTLPPAPARYEFRNDGTFETSGANAVKGRLPEFSTREVRAVVDLGDGSYSYELRAVLGQTATTTSYLLTPGLEGGLWIAKVATEQYDDKADPNNPKAVPLSTTTFDPTPDLQLLSFPLETGQEVTTRGVDTATGQVVALRSTIAVKDRVDACGELIDTQVATIDGEIGTCPSPPSEVPLPPPTPPKECDLSAISPSGERETFRGEYRFATQLGGLIVQDSVTILTERASGNIFRQNTAIVNRMPLPAKQPAKA